MKWCSYHFIGSYTNEVQLSQRLSVWQTGSAKDQARGVPMVADTHNEINQTSSFQHHSLSLARCTNHLPTANPDDNCIQNQILVYAADVLSCWCPLRVTCIRAVHCIRVQWLTSTTRNRLQLSWSGAQLPTEVSDTEFQKETKSSSIRSLFNKQAHHHFNRHHHHPVM